MRGDRQLMPDPAGCHGRVPVASSATGSSVSVEDSLILTAHGPKRCGAIAHLRSLPSSSFSGSLHARSSDRRRDLANGLAADLPDMPASSRAVGMSVEFEDRAVEHTVDRATRAEVDPEVVQRHLPTQRQDRIVG